MKRKKTVNQAPAAELTTCPQRDGTAEKGMSKIVAIKHKIDPEKGYRILLKLACGHEESIFKASRQPNIGDEQFCQTCAVAIMKGNLGVSNDEQS